MKNQAQAHGNEPTSERAQWISLLGKASSETLSEIAAAYGALPDYQWLRQPEVGLAMVRARTGGTGAQFNLGEMTVTRCALRLHSGQMGVAYVAGRDIRHAEYAAIFDALMQSEAHEEVRRKVLQPIELALAKRKSAIAAQAQATKVDFMTMVRGEDA
ncbi:phosphonate C-P lyase system protein PhnG [Noviherbaspirillum sp.]|uniref:phosphonate C-P lyase system protein PhnG n=1 Tax=Noviherbaspirillum sp. TaxID=1926288 RepID=UPI002FDF25AD